MDKDKQRKGAQRLVTLGWRALIAASILVIAVLFVAPYLNLAWLGFLAIPSIVIFGLLIVGLVLTFLGTASLRRP